MNNMWLNYFTKDDSFPFFIQYGGHEDTMFIHGHEDFSELVVVMDGTAEHIVENERFRIKKGDVLGYVNVYNGENQVGRIPITAQNDVKKLTFWVAFCRILKGLFKI